MKIDLKNITMPLVFCEWFTINFVNTVTVRIKE